MSTANEPGLAYDEDDDLDLDPTPAYVRAGDEAEAILDKIIAAAGGTRRDGQVLMARRVAEGLTLGRCLFAEGGTGIGKSLANLAGALASGKQTVMATHTKALQGQLVDDLEHILKATGLGSYALIKGRSSYVCKDKIKPAEEKGSKKKGQGSLLGDDQIAEASRTVMGEEFMQVVDWAKTSETGDRSDMPFTVSGKTWAAVSSTSEECAGSKCPLYDECFAERGRKAAADADVIVVNQSYLAQAMQIPPLLPDSVEAIIVDEAHMFGSVISEAFGAEITPIRLRNALKKCSTIGKHSINHQELASKSIEGLLGALERLQIDFTSTEAPEKIKTHVARVEKAFGDLRVDSRDMAAGNETQKNAKDAIQKMLDNLLSDLRLFAQGDTDTQVVWVEHDKARHEYALRSARFDAAQPVSELLVGRYGSVVFTSATLTINNSFDHARAMFGVPDAVGLEFESPFNYPVQGGLVFASGMPDPSKGQNKAEFSEAVADTASRYARAANGRTMVLCTSSSAVRQVTDRLRETLDLPVVSQADGADAKRLSVEFLENPNSVLVATKTFWTGVSFAGDACVCVVIDKIPFPVPTNPIIKARSERAVEAAKAAGREERDATFAGLNQVSIPEAALDLKQGAGRLIRTEKDRGVVVLCDPRLNPSRAAGGKGYARTLVGSLPPFSVISEETALAGLAMIAATADDSTDAVEIEVDADDPVGLDVV